jgi:hypothetical protein
MESVVPAPALTVIILVARADRGIDRAKRKAPIRPHEACTGYIAPTNEGENEMTFSAQIDDLTTALRHTRTRLLAPVDPFQQQLPRDPAIFVEDTLYYVMDHWAADLREQGSVLEEDTEWTGDGRSHYPRYVLRMAGGNLVQLHFTGEYPRSLFLNISKGFRNGQQFSDARHVQIELPITTDANALLASLLDGLKGVSV